MSSNINEEIYARMSDIIVLGGECRNPIAAVCSSETITSENG